MQDPVSGAIAGAIATAPMTAVMTSLRRRLPGARREAIPPRQITRTLAAKVAGAGALDSEQISAATYGAHVGYGAALGSVYPVFASRVGGAPVATGALFGLLVWGGSYLGWLPAAGILRSATREPAGRNVMMIAAHVVWGAATALLFEATRSGSSGEGGARSRARRRQAAGGPASRA
jgi:putative membrane protein